MSAIYIHIPFCKTRCIYCGFFSTTSLGYRDLYVDAVCAELLQRREYLHGDEVGSIYFGGGTPSQLKPSQISRILEHIYNIYNVRARAEITLEANPDDVTSDYLMALRQYGVNRLSMGVQTFDDSRLLFLNRRHNAQQAINAVELAQKNGFDNICVDLMFGFPGQTLDEWKQDVLLAVSLGVQHISAYSLMYDEGTLLEKMLTEGKVEEIDEEVSLRMYEYLIDTLSHAGYLHYEISNFCLPGYHSRHNSCYWQGVPYLGVGAGAHSFDGDSRQFNSDSLEDYFSKVPPVVEHLDMSQRYDEFVFTGLRTSEGLDLDKLKCTFGTDMYDYLMKNADKHILHHRMEISNGWLRLTKNGLFVSNDIMSDLMFV